MSWDVLDKIIVAGIVFFSAGYLILRFYRTMTRIKANDGVCADCPTRTGCQKARSECCRGKVYGASKY